MATIKYKGVGITAMSACVPKKIVYNKDLTDLLPKEELEKTIKSIGIEERRIADDDVFASDLAYKATVQLMEDNAIDPNSIDVLLFVSQTSDYRIPATAPILQHRLGLSKDTACLDITLGCSGFVFALSTAFAYASMEGVNRVLLLDGETFSKIVNERDKVDWPLYGDGATATLVEKGDFEETTFILRSDGAGEDAVKIPAGMRNPITKESLDVTEREDGNCRNDLEVYMNGMDVFNFAMSVVPSTIKEVCKTTGTELSDVDYLVFHQANKFMTDFFVKYLRFDKTKVPYCIQKYGNTSSTSVPLTMVSELEGKLENGNKIVMAGFGAGLSWGVALMSVRDIKISHIIEY